jgi:hypothetical protein
MKQKSQAAEKRPVEVEETEDTSQHPTRYIMSDVETPKHKAQSPREGTANQSPRYKIQGQRPNPQAPKKRRQKTVQSG